MRTKRITIDVPLDMKALIDAKCGKFKDYPSMQVFIFELLQNHFIKEVSVKTTDIKKEESNTLKDRFFNQGE